MNREFNDHKIHAATSYLGVTCPKISCTYTKTKKTPPHIQYYEFLSLYEQNQSGQLHANAPLFVKTLEGDNDDDGFG